MSIKISGVDVISNDRKWVGNTISNSVLEFKGSQVYNTETSSITLTSSSPQYIRINARVNSVTLPSSTTVAYGFKRFIIENNTTSPIRIQGTSVTIFPSNILFCSSGSDWTFSQVEKAYNPNFNNLKQIRFFAGSIGGSNIVRLSDSTAVAVYTAGASSHKFAIAIIQEGTNFYTGAAHTLFSTGEVYNSGLVALDSTRALVVYSYPTLDVHYAQVISVSGSTVTSGTPVQFYVTGTNVFNIAICKLDTDKALVQMRDGRALILTTSGTSVTVGTEYNLTSLLYNWGYLGALSSTRALSIFAIESASFTPYATIFENASGTVVTMPASPVSVGDGTGFRRFYGKGDLVVLNSTTAFSAYARHNSITSNAEIECNLYLINQNTISLVANETIYEDANSSTLNKVTLSSIGNKVFIMWQDRTSYDIKLIIATINGYTVDFSKIYTAISPGGGGIPAVDRSVALNDNTLFLLHEEGIVTSLKINTSTGN